MQIICCKGNLVDTFARDARYRFSSRSRTTYNEQMAQCDLLLNIGVKVNAKRFIYIQG